MPTDFQKAVRLARVLPPRQKEVLRELASGAERKQIAAKLEISENTVDVHCKNIYSRLGIHNVREAVRLAVVAFNL